MDEMGLLWAKWPFMGEMVTPLIVKLFNFDNLFCLINEPAKNMSNPTLTKGQNLQIYGPK